MRILQRRTVAATAAAVVVLLGLNGSSWAKTVRTHVQATVHAATKTVARTSKRTKGQKASSLAVVPMHGEDVIPGVMPTEVAEVAQNQIPANPADLSLVGAGVPVSGAAAPSQPVDASAVSVTHVDGKPYTLRMSNLHTGETLEIVYRIGNTYIPEALAKLNYFLRDHNTQDVVDYSPTEFDVLHAMMSRLGKVNGLIDIVCGYRTPETNEALRHDAPWTGVAEHSQHMEGHAIDLRVPGVSTAQLRNAALSLHAGGVGYYPTSQFVHVDVGPVRQWVHGRQAPTARRRSHRARSSAAM